MPKFLEKAEKSYFLQNTFYWVHFIMGFYGIRNETEALEQKGLT